MSAAGDIRMQVRDLRVELAETGEQILKGVSLELRPGRSVALVGANGAGKSTLLFLLMGFLQPQRGEIRVGEP